MQVVFFGDFLVADEDITSLERHLFTVETLEKNSKLLYEFKLSSYIDCEKLEGNRTISNVEARALLDLYQVDNYRRDKLYMLINK